MAEEEIVTMLCAKNKWKSTRTASTTTLRMKEMEAERNIGLLHGLAPGKLSELCLMHLTRMLDLDGEKFQLFALGNRGAKRSSLISPFRKKEKKENDGISTEHVSLIYRLISFLRKPEILKEEGLFRKTGNISRQRQLKEWLVTHPEELTNPSTFTAHDCANVLKSTLAELPQPLLTGRHFEAYRQASEFSERRVADAEARQLKVMQLLMLLLPRENAVLVELLMSLLYQVASEPNNKMTATALATMFAPHLMCCRKSEPEELRKDAAIATKSVTFLIEHSPELFKIPADLSVDVDRCIKSMKEQSEDGQLTPLALKDKKDEDTSPVRTVVSYAYNPKSGESGPQTDTQVALAELCAHVQSMPECARKKKLLKQFNQVTVTPKNKGRHSRSKTLSSSIKKHLPIFNWGKRRASDDCDVAVDCPTWNLVAIDIEEQSTEKATIVTCANSLTLPDATSLCKKLDYDDDGKPTSHKPNEVSQGKSNQRRRRRRSNGEAECTPPKMECLDKENMACNPKNPDKKGKERVKGRKERGGKSPLPSSENEISYLRMETRHCKFPLTTRQLSVVSPLRHRASFAYKSPQGSPHLLPLRPKSMILSPTSLETSL